MGTAVTTARPFARKADEGEARWFIGALAIIKSTGEETGGAMAVVELRAAEGFGSPLHVHTLEEEWFYVVEGALTIWVGGQVIEAPAGSFVFGPKDVPHTFVVRSPEARFLLGTQPAGFDEFIRAASTPAERLELPPVPPSEADLEAVVPIAAEYGMEITGPPGIPG
jgi:quercetin dioxygenase-like cupin family protein